MSQRAKLYVEVLPEEVLHQSFGADVVRQRLPSAVLAQQDVSHAARESFLCVSQPSVAVVQHQHVDVLHVGDAVVHRDVRHDGLHGVGHASATVGVGELGSGDEPFADGIGHILPEDAAGRGGREDDGVGRLRGPLPRTGQYIRPEHVAEAGVGLEAQHGVEGQHRPLLRLHLERAVEGVGHVGERFRSAAVHGAQQGYRLHGDAAHVDRQRPGGQRYFGDALPVGEAVVYGPHCAAHVEAKPESEQAGGQSGDAHGGLQLILPQVAPGYFQIVCNHCLLVFLSVVGFMSQSLCRRPVGGGRLSTPAFPCPAAPAGRWRLPRRRSSLRRC